MRIIKPGMRVRLNVRTIGGKEGPATVVSYDDGTDDTATVGIWLDGEELSLPPTYCCRHEISVTKDQTPNPQHAGWKDAYLRKENEHNSSCV